MDLNSDNIPNHVAVIMDGNARWAKSRNLPVSIGHKNGAGAIRSLVESAIEFGVKYLTIFAFSTENWQRPQGEVAYLMKLMESYLDNEAKKLIDSNVKILVSGNLESLDDKVRNKIDNLQKKTSDNSALTLNVAFDYGARREIVDAFKKIISNIDLSNNISIKDLINEDLINEDLVSENLYHPLVPDPDLIIRTAGEKRLSNFLLWQLAYSELYFTDILWPDFGRDDLLMAVNEFQKRKRNYGKR